STTARSRRACACVARSRGAIARISPVSRPAAKPPRSLGAWPPSSARWQIRRRGRKSGRSRWFDKRAARARRLTPVLHQCKTASRAQPAPSSSHSFSERTARSRVAAPASGLVRPAARYPIGWSSETGHRLRHPRSHGRERLRHVEARRCTLRDGWLASTHLRGDAPGSPNVRSLDQRRAASDAGVGAMTPPGTRLRALAARLCAPMTMERLVDPAIADLQAEYEEASRAGAAWRRRWIWMRGHVAFLTMIVVHGRAAQEMNGGLTPLRGLSLDVRLALRLLVKHLGLTVVGTIAMAFAIWSGIVAFEFYTQIMRPALPLAGGDRIVGIVMADTATRGERAPTLHDFVAWRDALTSVPDLAAYRDRNWNVIVGDAAPEPVPVAEISAATFRVLRERPVLGRPLVEADEKPGAPWVVLIGHDVWQSRFESDPNVIGRELRLGNVPHTIVGVMPEGFRFPLAHGFWVPLRLDPVNYPRQQSPVVRVFGRLSPGATLEAAQPELTVLGARAATAFP